MRRSGTNVSGCKKAPIRITQTIPKFIGRSSADRQDKSARYSDNLNWFNALNTHLDSSEMRSDKIASVYRWWSGHDHGDIPDRAHLDPTDIKSILPSLLIADVELNPFRIRYRLVGTLVAEATGLNFTGRYLDELIPGDAEEPWMEEYKRSYTLRSPVFGVASAPTTMGVRFSYEFGIFPLRNGGSTISQFVSVEDYFDFKRRAGEWEQWEIQTSCERRILADDSLTRLVVRQAL